MRLEILPFLKHLKHIFHRIIECILCQRYRKLKISYPVFYDRFYVINNMLMPIYIFYKFLGIREISLTKKAKHKEKYLFLFIELPYVW